jgi:hypothetical protein
MKYTTCPECGMIWKPNEIEFQVCDNCGYENPDTLASIKIRFSNITRILIRWLIVIIGTALCLALYNWTVYAPTRVGNYLIFFIASFMLILLTSNLQKS